MGPDVAGTALATLIADIEANGEADTAAEAEARPVPSFPASAARDCPAG